MTPRFLVDECAGPALARWLRDRGYDVASVYDENRGIADLEVLAWAVREERVLITAGKDFGELIYRDARRHRSVLLLRLADERAQNKMAVTERVLNRIGSHLADRFSVATERHLRVNPPVTP